MVETVTEKKTQESPSDSADLVKKQPGVKKPSMLLGYLIQLIIVIALAGISYFSWQQQTIIAELINGQNQLATENRELLTRLQNIQQDIENINNAEASAEILFNQQNARLDNLNEEMVSLRLGLNANQANGVWQIVEAASLLRLADQFLELNQDVSVALSLYQDSYAILEQLDDPSLGRIKNLLSTDIRNLRNNRGVDVDGFYMRLSDISQQLDNINLGVTIEPSPDFLEGDAGEVTEGFFNNIKNIFAHYFTVRKLDAPMDIPLNDQQVSFLRQNMQLQIEQAKLALLQRRQSLYQDSISIVLLLAQKNIAEGVQQKAYIIRELSELQGETILLDLPRMSDSLTLLENLMSNLTFESGE